MQHVIITGVPGFDGRYPFDLEHRELTTREWGWIKRLAGYLPLALDDDAFGDPELITVFAAIALRRQGKVEAADVPRAFETLSDAPFGAAITLETDEEAQPDAGPPPPSSNENGVSSGTDSPTISETSAEILNSSGTPASATSESAQPRLVS